MQSLRSVGLLPGILWLAKQGIGDLTHATSAETAKSSRGISCVDDAVSLSDIKVAGPNSAILTVRPRAWRLQCAARSPRSKYPSLGFWGRHPCVRLPASCEDVRIPLSHHQACSSMNKNKNLLSACPSPQRCYPEGKVRTSKPATGFVLARFCIRAGANRQHVRSKLGNCLLFHSFKLIDAALGHRKQLCVSLFMSMTFAAHSHSQHLLCSCRRISA